MRRRPMLHPALVGLLTAAFASAFAGAAASEALRMNQVQVIGTHNSYHAGLTPTVAKLIAARDPKAAAALDYQHGRLTQQLDAGIRQIELDIYADAKGGRFAHPFGAALAGKDAPSFDPSHAFDRPGFKVMHIQDLDYLSTCQPFAACLAEVRAWSRARPSHAPVFILVETKTQPPLPGTPMVAPEPFTPAVMDALDAEVRSVFPEAELITPDRVRGPHATLDEAVATDGWPTLAAARGKVVFLLDQTDVSAAYLTGHPALRGRVAFTNARPGQPDAGFVEMNEGSAAEIADAVRRGYLVRTRADADTVQARTGDVTRRDEALRSGAQMVSTDYPWFEPSRWTGYSVALPGQAAVRCNPVNAPAVCRLGPVQ